MPYIMDNNPEHYTEADRVPSALNRCNSCEFRPMALGDNPMGYCLPCLAEVMGADDNGR